MSARPIGEIIQPIMARIRRSMAVQELLDACPTAEARRGLIVSCYTHGAIEREEAALLVSTNQLETA